MRDHDRYARPVYSSEEGRLCPDCGAGRDRCRCRDGRHPPAGDGVVRIRRETGGRGGKTVTVISGLPLQGAQLKALVKDLKRCCGTGGTIKEGMAEIQGDHVDRLVEALRQRGFTVKRAGG